MMKRSILIPALLVLALNTISAQEKQNVIEKGEDIAKMTLAQQSFYGGDYQKAIGLYKDVLAGKPNDANVIGHIGECYYAMGQM